MMKDTIRFVFLPAILILMAILTVNFLSPALSGGWEELPASAPKETQRETSPKAESKTEKPATKIDINTASVEELTVLPMIGEARAKSIVDYRTKNGPFRSIEEIVEIKGIDVKIFTKIKDSICVKK